MASVFPLSEERIRNILSLFDGKYLQTPQSPKLYQTTISAYDGTDYFADKTTILAHSHSHAVSLFLHDRLPTKYNNVYHWSRVIQGSRFLPPNGLHSLETWKTFTTTVGVCVKCGNDYDEQYEGIPVYSGYCKPHFLTHLPNRIWMENHVYKDRCCICQNKYSVKKKGKQVCDGLCIVHYHERMDAEYVASLSDETIADVLFDYYLAIDEEGGTTVKPLFDPGTLLL